MSPLATFDTVEQQIEVGEMRHDDHLRLKMGLPKWFKEDNDQGISGEWGTAVWYSICFSLKSREDLNKVEVESSVRTKRPTSSKIDGNSWHGYVTK